MAGLVGGAYGIRTRDLRLERAMSLATRRMRRLSIVLCGALGSIACEFLRGKFDLARRLFISRTVHLYLRLY